jgi:hypothetical protein
MKALDRIQKIREDNNRLWMEILRIALRKSPKKTKDVLARINFNDSVVTKLLKDIAGE